MTIAALRAERIALAIVNGEIPSSADAMADLRLANREREVEQNAQAVRSLQSGARPWAVPAQAPWAGFGAV